MAKLLLKNGASIHDEDADGMTPILRLSFIFDPMNLLTIVMKVVRARKRASMSACLRARGGRVGGMDVEGGERNW